MPGCDLTDDKVMDCLLANNCQVDGKRGLRGTFWNNTEMSGKAVTTQIYTQPVAVTTAGMHNFAPNVALEDFSAKYETTFTPKENGEYVVNVMGTGDFDVLVNGERKQHVHSWRCTPTRTPIQAEAGRAYNIEIRYKFVKTWGADIKINVAKELPIDYAATIAQLKDIEKVIFVGGISPALEGEEMPVEIEGFKGGDRTNIELPAVQRNFLKALKAAGKTVIYVNCSGSAIALTPETETCDAIVQAWYAGQEGGTAVADVLFGDVNPSGKLPVTFYRSTSQLPDYEDYSMKGRTYRYFSDPLFAFGYGLNYSVLKIGSGTLKNGEITLDNEHLEFSMSDLKGGKLKLTVPVSNMVKRKGTEVVQLYVRDLADTEGPLKSLRGFKRVTVTGGTTENVDITLTAKTFELFDPATNTVHTHPGKYEIMYGNSSRPEDLKVIKVKINN